MGGTRVRVLAVFLFTFAAAAPPLLWSVQIARAPLPTAAIQRLPPPASHGLSRVRLSVWLRGGSDAVGHDTSASQLHTAVDSLRDALQHAVEAAANELCASDASSGACGAAPVAAVDILTDADVGIPAQDEVGHALAAHAARTADDEGAALTAITGTGPVHGYLVVTRATRDSAAGSQGGAQWVVTEAGVPWRPVDASGTSTVDAVTGHIAAAARALVRVGVGACLAPPIGFDQVPASLHIAVSVINADPDDWRVVWNAEAAVEEAVLRPLQQLGQYAGMHVSYSTQRVVYADLVDRVQVPPAALHDGSLAPVIITDRALESFISSVGEWDAPGSPEAAEGAKVLRLALYVPPAAQCPLLVQRGTLRRPKGEPSTAFMVHGWGGVVVVNPAACAAAAADGRRVRSGERTDAALGGSATARRSIAQLVAQTRALIGLPGTCGSCPGAAGGGGDERPVVGGRAVVASPWEATMLRRHWFRQHTRAAAASLRATAQLADSMAHMRVSTHLASQVEASLRAYLTAVDASATDDVAARAALSSRVGAEAAALDPNMVPQLYFPGEHLAAVYAPFLLPLALPVVLGTVAELRAWRRKRHAHASIARE